MTNPTRAQPWWLKNADTGKTRRFDSYEAACAAGIRAYHRLVAKGFYAEDTFHVVSGGEWYSVAPMAHAKEGSTP